MKSRRSWIKVFVAAAAILLAAFLAAARAIEVGGAGGTPIVSTEGASVDGSNVVFHGTVDPNGWDTTYYFEFGRSGSFTSSTSAFAAGSGVGPLAVDIGVSDLDEFSVYTYRLVAYNTNGVTYGLPNTVVTSGEIEFATQFAASVACFLDAARAD